jgi:hypothetical protein
MLALALLLGAIGLVTLVRPGLVQRLFGWPPSEGATYALRIAGMMLTAAGLFLGGFATMFRIASAG